MTITIDTPASDEVAPSNKGMLDDFVKVMSQRFASLMAYVVVPETTEDPLGTPEPAPMYVAVYRPQTEGRWYVPVWFDWIDHNGVYSVLDPWTGREEKFRDMTSAMLFIVNLFLLNG